MEDLKKKGMNRHDGVQYAIAPLVTEFAANPFDRSRL
jgi:hypothetical protein